MDTFHASPEKDSREQVQKQMDLISSIGYLNDLVNALPYPVLILNEKRQVVYSNTPAIKELKAGDLSEFLGKRTGEVLNCIHSNDCESGCGTSESCRVCGAVNTILRSQRENRSITDDCRITGISNGFFEFYNYEVTATPLKLNGVQFTVFSLFDNTALKKKEMLENLFYHDILNTAGNLKNLTNLIPENRENDREKKIIRMIQNLSHELVEEINGQRHISKAESQELVIENENLNSIEILDMLSRVYSNFEGRNNTVTIDEDSDEISFSSDRGLISRILKNMVKNAVESHIDDVPVEIGAYDTEECIRFKVSNPGVIPEDIQKQIFQKGFSSKSRGRGFGTYSMKLLGEGYLKGKVYFESKEPEGTVFYFDLPN